MQKIVNPKRAIFITIHVGVNFGSVLQTYATEYILRNMGIEAYVLDYRPPRISYKRLIQSPENRWYKAPLRLLFSFLVRCFNDYIYMGFVKRNCHLTPTFYSVDEMKVNLPEADYYITGSDQVWNSTHNEGVDEMYYFPYVPANKPIIAFSSSFGKESLPEEETKIILPFLKRYQSISVREESGIKLLEKMGIQNTVHLLDPTLLLDKSIWRSLFVKKPLIYEPYILIFLPYNTVSKDIVYKTARKIAKKQSLKIVTFSWGLSKEKLADRTFRFANPEDFLSLFYYADCVITNSFHGTAFAINFNKQVWVYEPSAFSTRLVSLLRLVGLEKRILSDIIDEEKLVEPINYQPVNEILDAERKKAHLFLKKALNP